MGWQQRVHNISVGFCLAAALCVGFSVSAYADQTAEELPELFDQLKSLKSFEQRTEASQLEQAIWAHWLTGPDKASDQMMLQIQSSMELGRHDLGLLLCNQLVDAYPNFAEGWNKRATILYLLNRPEESVADIRTTLELEPNHFGALSGLGLILLGAGDAEGALHAFEEVLAITPLSLNAKLNASRAREAIGTDI